MEALYSDILLHSHFLASTLSQTHINRGGPCSEHQYACDRCIKQDENALHISIIHRNSIHVFLEARTNTSVHYRASTWSMD